MSPIEFAKLETVLNHVQSWPAPVQLSLATRILQSLEASAVRPGGSLRKLLGLLAPNGTPPSDAECETIVSEERLRKYS